MRTTIDASVVWKFLNGIICIYKPPNKSLSNVRSVLKNRLCEDLNSMKVRPPTPYVLIGPGKDSADSESELDVKVIPSYADNVLVTGPRYIPEEIKCYSVHKLAYRMSGLLLMGINDGCRMVRKTNYHQLVRVYQVGVRLGYETDSGWYDEGTGIVKAKYMHVPHVAVNSVLTAIQAGYQRRAFDYAGVLPDSQEAFELAKSGLIKPKSTQGTVVYSARTLNFKPPDFTIELHTLNETEDFFYSLVTELGRRVRSAASVTSIKCVQIGNFGVDNSLSSAEWNLQKITRNMRLCYRLSKENPELRKLNDLDKYDFDGEPIYNLELKQ